MKNKKIAILTPTFSHFSGIDRVVELQAKEFLKNNNKVAVFCLKADIKLQNIKVIELGMPKNNFISRLYRLFFFLDRKKIKKYAKMLKDYDLVISHFYPMNIIASYAKKKFGVKYVYHNHGIAYPSLFKNPFERLYMVLFRYFSNKSIKNATSAVSISKFLKNELKKETGINSTIEYDPIDTKRFHKSIDGKKIKAKYKIKDEPVCLYVGRISPHKGVHLLIEAFNIVLKSIPNAKLIIAGKPTFDNYLKKLKKLAKKNVIFAGFVDDKELPYYYSACDVYTTASLWEGYNMTIAEANACGKPAVAFDIGAHPEVLKKGKLVKKNDVGGFSRAILSFIN
jgi:1,2-diacylglycerol 3-alpha-glucosyltransferase